MRLYLILVGFANQANLVSHLACQQEHGFGPPCCALTRKRRSQLKRKSSLEAARAHLQVNFVSPRRSVERLRATQSNAGWHGQPRLIDKATQVSRDSQIDACASNRLVQLTGIVGQTHYRFELLVKVMLMMHATEASITKWRSDGLSFA